jgi:phage terminase large subunit-like protein
MKKGTIKYKSPMTHCLTTPGFNIGGPAHVHYEYCTKILNGVLDNERLFIAIYELDEGDDFTNTAVWLKSNPGLGVSPKIEPIIDELNEALAKGGFSIVDFKTKHMGMWVSNASEWIPLSKYKRTCTSWTLSDYYGYDAFGALDMAYSDRGDVAAFGMIIPMDDVSVKCFNRYYIPEEKAKLSTEIDYLRMAELGHVVITPGDTTDYDCIMNDLLFYAEKLNIRLINFDAWNISYFYEQMVKNGLNVQKFNQSVPYMSPPTKRIGEMIHKKQIDFGTNPVTQWMFSNVFLKDVGNGNVKMIRENTKKIDGAVTAVMAYSAWHEYKINNPKFDVQIINL